MSNTDKDKDKVDEDKKPTPPPTGPLIPVCTQCQQPFTRCKCKHNTLQK